MRASLARTLSACLLLLAASGNAAAGGFIDELRLGGLAQNIEPTGRGHEHGTTNKLYAGLTWDAPLAQGFFVEGSFGLALHDGGLDEPGRAHYGCRLNFRESAALGYDIDPHWRVMLMVDHMSNADLCLQNRGLTNAGLRLGYRLD